MNEINYLSDRFNHSEDIHFDALKPPFPGQVVLKKFLRQEEGGPQKNI